MKKKCERRRGKEWGREGSKEERKRRERREEKKKTRKMLATKCLQSKLQNIESTLNKSNI